MSNGKSTKEKKKNIKKKKKIIGLKIFLFLLLIIAIAGGVLAYRTLKLGGGMEGFLAAAMGHTEETKKNLDTINFLLLGKSQNLTDTIIVCSYNPREQSASMFSIPRDTFVGKNKKRATASDKINSLYQISPEKTIQAVNNITGLNLKYYAMIDTASLRKVVDAIGGVYYTVPRNMDYDDPTQKLHIHLKEGYQLLNGDKAEQLLRFRHGNKLSDTYSEEWGEQDIGRMKTQRAFLVEAAKQTLQFKNIFKLGQFLEIAHQYLETNIPLNLVKDYIPYAVEFNPNNIKSDVLPGTPEKCNGVWIYSYDKEQADALISQLFPQNSTVVKETNNSKETSEIKIELLNGTGNKTTLTEVTNLLKEKGYTITKSGSTSSTSKTTIVNRTSQTKATAEDIKNLLNIGNITTGEKSYLDVDFTIIIGKDYNN